MSIGNWELVISFLDGLIDWLNVDFLVSARESEAGEERENEEEEEEEEEDGKGR